MGKLIDLTGQRFGRLTVLSRAENSPQNGAQWQCRCDCGETLIVPRSSLVRGLTKSCGCLKLEISRKNFNELKKRQKIRSLTRKRELYNVWRQMKYRCQNPKAPGYHNYGGRGISICDEWLNDYFAFQQWALESGYRAGLSIDRKDNDGPYTPENCRWTTQKVQSNNQRKTIILSFRGEEKPLSVWAHELGMSRFTLTYRIKSGWSIERALTEPVQKHKKKE